MRTSISKVQLLAMIVSTIAVGLLSSGCSIETKIEDLNKIKKPITTSNNPFAVRVSAGSQSLYGTEVDADVAIGLKTHAIKGTHVDMEATMSSARPD